MSEAKITSKGQITIPKDIRNHLQVDTGDILEFIHVRDGIQIVAKTMKAQALQGIIEKPQQPVSVDDMNRAIRSRRKC